MEEGLVKLTSLPDKMVFEVRKPVAEMVLQKKLDNISNELLVDRARNAANLAVYVPAVRGAILAKVVEYCNYHAESDPGTEVDDNCDTWDDKFIKVLDDKTLFGVARAAAILEISELRDLAGKKVTESMPGFIWLGIDNVFDPEHGGQEIVHNKGKTTALLTAKMQEMMNQIMQKEL